MSDKEVLEIVGSLFENDVQRDDSIKQVIESQLISDKQNSKRYRETELPGGVIMSKTRQKVEEATSNDFEQEEF